jgi:hypothetical protein
MGIRPGLFCFRPSGDAKVRRVVFSEPIFDTSAWNTVDDNGAKGEVAKAQDFTLYSGEVEF